eukprot:CAMPEP_0119546526 /NCGR_PEP_ID=MMETSP1352-20130426/911_1 /TAXON_ID=265584 /ORGANISM="Stauroneis constricta, Strain CCMP1120" /LENGTH=130 /DNA_ID=CAMNT_0007591237 /DNA_START=650 /DNA_END=1042 /DNA_ORIENTATION=+
MERPRLARVRSNDHSTAFSMSLDDIFLDDHAPKRESFHLSCWDNRSNDSADNQSCASSLDKQNTKEELSQNNTTKMVRFNLLLDIHEIDRIEIQDYPYVYYGANELQCIMDEYKMEERRQGRVVVSLPRD